MLLLTSGPLDGRAGADTQLAEALVAGMPETDFLYFAPWPRRRHPDAPTGGRGLPVASWDGTPRVPERLQVALASAAVARRVDLVHAVLTIGSAFPAFSRARGPLLGGGTPVLHTVPGVRDPALPARSRPLGRTVALSRTTARTLSEAGFGEVRVVPPMIELDRWPPAERVRGATPMVLFAGHHDVGGGAVEAIEAAAAAARTGTRLRLVLAVRGRPGEDRARLTAELRRRAVHRGLAEPAVLGYVDDMRALITSADVLLFPPRGLTGKADVPLSVLEALATGRPVLLSDLPEFDALGDAVLRAPPGDADRTGALLARLLAEPGWWARCAATGRRTVAERFGRRPFLDAYRALYGELLHGDERGFAAHEGAGGSGR